MLLASLEDKLVALRLPSAGANPRGSLGIDRQEPRLTFAHAAGAGESTAIEHRRAAAVLRIADGLISKDARAGFACDAGESLAVTVLIRVVPFLCVAAEGFGAKIHGRAASAGLKDRVRHAVEPREAMTVGNEAPTPVTDLGAARAEGFRP